MSQDNCNPSKPSVPIIPINVPETNILIPNDNGGFNIDINNGGRGAGGAGAGGGGAGGGGAGGGGAGGGGAGAGGGGAGGSSPCDPKLFKEGSKKKNVEANKKTKKITKKMVVAAQIAATATSVLPGVAGAAFSAFAAGLSAIEESQNSKKSTSGILVPTEAQHAKTHGKEIPCAEECEECEHSPMYPFNKVEQTESGHIIEKDDTPGSERLSVSHRTGTFFELSPFGSFNATIVRDAWLSVYRDAHLHVDGYTHVTLDKGLKIVVNKDKIPNCPDKAVNFDVFVRGNANLNIVLEGGSANVRIHDGDVNLLMEKGDVNIRQEDGNYNHYVKGDYNLQVDGHMHTVVKGDVVNEIGGFRDTKVWGLFDHLELEKGDLDIEIKKGNNYISIGGFKQEEIVNGYELFIDKGNFNILCNMGNISINTKQGGFNLSSMENINLYSQSSFLVTTEDTQEYYTKNDISIQTLKDINVTAKRDILAKGRFIHLNGKTPLLSNQAENKILSKTIIPSTKSKWTPTKSRIRECE